MRVHISDYASHEAYEIRSFDSDARWAEADELKSQFTRIDADAERLDAGGVPIINENGRELYIDTGDSNTCVFGSTRSMKTRRIVLQTVNSLLLARESIIVNDPKGELYRRTSGLAAKNHRVVVINMRSPKQSDTFNLLGAAYYFYSHGDRDRAAELINDLAYMLIQADEQNTRAEPFWSSQATIVFLGLVNILMICATKDEATMKSLVYLRNRLIECDDYSNLSDVLDIVPKDSLLYPQLSSLLSAPDRTRASIVSELDSKLRIFFSQRDLTEMLSGNGIDFSTVGKQPTAIYLIVPDEKKTYAGLVSILIKSIYEMLIYVSQNEYDGVLPVRVNFICDEFGQLGRIADFDSMVSAGLGRNVRFLLVIQNMLQIQSKYGEADAESILANCINHIFLTSRELPLLQRLSALCGTTHTGRPLISPARLQHLSKEKGQALVFAGRNYPYITTLADIDETMFPNYDPMPMPNASAVKPKLFDPFNCGNRLMRLKMADKDEYEPLPDDYTEKAVEKSETLNDNMSSIDLQRELERKFDELFGRLDDDEDDDD